MDSPDPQYKIKDNFDETDFVRTVPDSVREEESPKTRRTRAFGKAKSPFDEVVVEMNDKERTAYKMRAGMLGGVLAIFWVIELASWDGNSGSMIVLTIGLLIAIGGTIKALRDGKVRVGSLPKELRAARIRELEAGAETAAPATTE